MWSQRFLLGVLLLARFAAGHVDYQPQQVHLAFGGNHTSQHASSFRVSLQKKLTGIIQLSPHTDNSIDIVVTWSTIEDARDSIVEYGIGGFILSASGVSTRFVDGGSAGHSQYIHKVTLRDLQPATKYVYHCGGHLGWSPEFWFVTSSASSQTAVQVAIYGDMGNDNAQSMAMLQEDTQRQMYDAIIHVGDFAYDMNSENAEVGDQFMRQIETIAAYTPYMVCAGNHEEK